MDGTYTKHWWAAQFQSLCCFHWCASWLCLRAYIFLTFANDLPKAVTLHKNLTFCSLLHRLSTNDHTVGTRTSMQAINGFHEEFRRNLYMTEDAIGTHSQSVDLIFVLKTFTLSFNDNVLQSKPHNVLLFQH